MARYQGQVAVFRATVPLGVKTPDYTFAEQDRRRQVHRARSGRSSASCPSELCTDEQFIRRVYLDITGTLPTPKQVTAFVADKDADEARQAGRSRCSRRRSTPTTSPTSGPTSCASSARQPGQTGATGTFAFHDWIREAIADDKPYDEFVRDILAATGDETEEPADGLVQGAADSPSSSWTTPPRCSSACGSPAPSATTTRTRSGARTITGAWPRSSAASAARTSRCPAASPNQQAAARR